MKQAAFEVLHSTVAAWLHERVDYREACEVGARPRWVIDGRRLSATEFRAWMDEGMEGEEDLALFRSEIWKSDTMGYIRTALIAYDMKVNPRPLD